MAQKVGELEAELLLDIVDFVRNAKKAQAQTKKFGKSMKIAGAVTAAAVAGIFVAVKAFKQLAKVVRVTTKAAGVQEAAMVKLSAALRTAGVQDANRAAQDFALFAAELQKVSTLGDETTIAAASIGASFGITGVKLAVTTEAAADLAAAIGVDLKAAMILLGKAAKGETGSLSRYGIVLDKNLKPAEKFDAALAAINEQFGGAAQALANSYTGRMIQLSNAYGDVLEEIGFVITKNKTFNALLVEGRKRLEGASAAAIANRAALSGIVSGGISVALQAIGGFIKGLGNVVLAFKLVQSGGSTFKAFIVDIGVGFLDTFIKMAEGINKLENRIREFFGKPPVVDELLEEIKRVRDGLVDSREQAKKAAASQAESAATIQQGFKRAADEVDGFRRAMLITADTIKITTPPIKKGVKDITDETAKLCEETDRCRKATEEFFTIKEFDLALEEQRLAKMEESRAAMESQIEVMRRFGDIVVNSFLNAETAQDAWRNALKATLMEALNLLEDFVIKSILASAVDAAGKQAASVSAVPPPVGPILMAAAATAGFALVKGLLAKAKFAHGGIVGGASGPDQVPALLTKGEAVIPAPVVAEIARVLSLPRAPRPVVPFQQGGMVQGSPGQGGAAVQNVTNISVQTLALENRARTERWMRDVFTPAQKRANRRTGGL